MRKNIFGSLALGLAVSAVAAGLFVGCEKSQTKSSSSTSTPPTSAAPSVPAVPTTAASEAGASVTDTAKTASEQVKSTATSATEQAGAATTNPAAEGDAKAQATDLLTKVTTYVKENKMDLAQKALDELDKLKPQLPEAYQSKIDAAHTMFDTAKKGQGLGDLKNKVLGK